MKKSVRGMFAVVFLYLVSNPAVAITWGVPDGDDHPFVGLLLFTNHEGELSHRCSGTLIAPMLVLTAAHCAYNMARTRVWFDSDLSSSGYPEAGPNSIEGTPYSHPGFNGGFQLPNNYDVGVVVLDEPVTHLGYGELLEPGILDRYATKRGQTDVSFTPVGYGLQRVVPSRLAALVRHKAESMLINLNSAITDGYNLHTSNNPGLGNGEGGTCFGDSGGPVFFENSNRIAAVTSFGFSVVCGGSDFAYRVDIPESIHFLQGFLP